MQSVVPSAKTYTSSVPSGPGRTSVSSVAVSASSSNRFTVRSWSVTTGVCTGTKSGCEGWRRRAAASSGESSGNSAISVTSATSAVPGSSGRSVSSPISCSARVRSLSSTSSSMASAASKSIDSRPAKSACRGR